MPQIGRLPPWLP